MRQLFPGNSSNFFLFFFIIHSSAPTAEHHELEFCSRIRRYSREQESKSVLTHIHRGLPRPPRQRGEEICSLNKDKTHAKSKKDQARQKPGTIRSRRMRNRKTQSK